MAKVSIQDGTIKGEVDIGAGSISANINPNDIDAATVGMGSSGIVPGGNPLLPGGGEVSTEISISGKGVGIEAGLDSKNIGLGGKVNVDISPSGDRSSAEVNIDYGGQEIIDINAVSEGCTISVQLQLWGGQTVTHTYTNPKCKQDSPAPSPSPTPSPTPTPNSKIDVSGIGDSCIVYAAWLGKKYEAEYFCYLATIGADGSKNYYWNTFRIGSTPQRGDLSTQFGVINASLPDSNPNKFGWISVSNGEENAGVIDGWMVNINFSVNGYLGIRLSYSQPVQGGWFRPGEFGRFGTYQNTGANFKQYYNYLLAEYSAGVDIDIRVKCNPQAPIQYLPNPVLKLSPPWNSPPMSNDKCCSASTSMLRKLMRVLAVDEIDGKGFDLDNRFLVTNGSGKSTVKTYAGIYELIIKMLAHGMIFAPKVKIKDASSAKAGDQSIELSYLNATSWAQGITEMVYECMDDGNVGTNMDIRTGVTVTQTMLAVVDCVRKLDAVLDVLGVQLKQRRELVSTNYDLTLGGKGFDEKKQQLDLTDDAATEELLPALLKTRDNPLKTTEMHPSADSIMETLIDIKRAISAAKGG